MESPVIAGSGQLKQQVSENENGASGRPRPSYSSLCRFMEVATKASRVKEGSIRSPIRLIPYTGVKMSEKDIGREYLTDALRNFRSYKKLAEEALAQTSDEDVFRLIDPHAN